MHYNICRWARLQKLLTIFPNAISFTTNGTVTVKVYEAEVESDAENDEANKESIVVEVKDTGTGISAEMLPRLFEKFATRSVSGTGLGLYISKSIGDNHGGKLWANNNREEKGATFTFTIPINQKEDKK